MGRIAIEQKINAGREETWNRLADLATHPIWMKDAQRLEFLSEQSTGIGTTMRVRTRIGPIRTIDMLEVVSWVPGDSIGVVHRGIIRGVGEFRVSGDAEASSVTWEEELLFPWWCGGPITAWLARPVLIWIWRENLRRFALLVANG